MKKFFENSKITLLLFSSFAVLTIVIYSHYFDLYRSYIDDVKLWREARMFYGVMQLLLLSPLVFWSIKKELIPKLYYILSIIGYSILLTYFISISDELFPWSIPQWAREETSTFGYYYVLHFILILYGIFALLFYTKKQSPAYLNLIFAFAIPVLWYFIINTIIPLFNGGIDQEYILICSMIISVALFLFFILQVFMNIFQKRNVWNNYKIYICIFVGLVFPILGLIVNQVGPFELSGESNIFGNFSSPYFYAIAIFNGIILILYTIVPLRFTTAVFLYIALSVGFSYVLYFFLIFIPFLPLSLLAIVVFGYGILMLTPVVLFWVEVKVVSELYEILRLHLRPFAIFSIGFMSFLVIPLVLIFSMSQDKKNLHRALDSLYAYDIKSFETPEIDISGLESALNSVQANQSRDFFAFNHQTPILSDVYRQIVMDNLKLSAAKQKKLKTLYSLDSESYDYVTTPIDFHPEVEKSDSLFELMDYRIKTVQKEDYYETWIDFEIQNKSPYSFIEFKAEFTIPETVFVQNYYLDIEEERVYGLLAEQKSATWIYNSIRNINRDPGFLRYNNHGNLDLSIFPFEENQVRTSGIQFIHRDAFEFNIQEKQITVSVPSLPAQKSDTFESITSNSYDYDSLMLEPKLYVILNSNYLRDEPIKAQKTINELATYKPAYFIADNGIREVKNPLQTLNWDSLGQYEFPFFRDKAVKTIMYHASQDTTHYPIVYILGANHQALEVEDNYSYFEFLNPGLVLTTSVKEVTENYKPKTFGKSNNSSNAIFNFANVPVLLPKPEPYLSTELSAYQKACEMTFQYRNALIQNENKNTSWLENVKYSFENHTLSPTTAFISLENESQRKILLQKQKEILQGKFYFDPSAENVEMSEPSPLAIIIVLFLLFLLKKYYSKPSLFTKTKL